MRRLAPCLLPVLACVALACGDATGDGADGGLAGHGAAGAAGQAGGGSGGIAGGPAGGTGSGRGGGNPGGSGGSGGSGSDGGGGSGGNPAGGAPGTGGAADGSGRGGAGGGSVAGGGAGGGSVAGVGGRGGSVAGSGGGPAGSGGRGGGVGGGGAGGRPNVAVYIAGDSTVQTYTGSTIHQGGWGQFFADYFVPQVTVQNRAIGGRTARRFVEEGRLTTILSALRPGDYLFVQFGTNDSNRTATYDDGEPYYLAPDTDFKTYLQMYIDGAKGRSAIPVLVTPPPRNSCRTDGVSFNYSFTAYATAMKELGQANTVAVVDLGTRAVAYLDGKADCNWASENFFLVRADGTVDGTHFQETGANVLAGLVADGVVALALPLAAYHR